MSGSSEVILVERVTSARLIIRSQRVMLDAHLAILYEVETKVLNQAVKRHRNRFPPDFMFQLTNEESGTYNHHMVITFEIDITKLLDFDIEWIWDRIQNPRENADGTVPQQDDYRTQIMLGFNF